MKLDLVNDDYKYNNTYSFGLGLPLKFLLYLNVIIS